MQITYEDKVNLHTSAVPRKNKVTDADLNEIKQVVNHNDTPIGSGHEYFGTTLPTNYVWADGSAISRTDYSELFEVIGTTYGTGDGTTTFNVPDLRRRHPIMKDSDDTIGTTGGSEEIYAQANPIGTGILWQNPVVNFTTNYSVTGFSGGTKSVTTNTNTGAGIQIRGRDDDTTSRELYIICNYIIRAK